MDGWLVCSEALGQVLVSALGSLSEAGLVFKTTAIGLSFT